MSEMTSNDIAPAGNGEGPSEYKLSDLAAKVRDNQPLTDGERQVAATLLKFSEMIGAGHAAACSYGAIATLAGYREDESTEDGATPMFFVIACDDPHPETWAAIQAALDGDEVQS